ncbi:MAG: GntR family transcriptional regulator [Firmicutes bacterium]|nr:GntR family transcriptional regulator [Bacillota bacterium]
MNTNPIDQNTNAPLTDHLFAEVQKWILSGELPAGSKLTEKDLCKKLNVSRTPIREAFRQLESEGLIEKIPNRGAFVVGLSNRDISDLFDLRLLFEVQAVEWAIQRMTDEEISSLREIIEFMEFYTVKNDIDKVLQFNSNFHNTIYVGTQDRMLQKTLAAYQTYLKHSAPPRTFTGDYLDTILKEHKAIFEAFESRNVAAGRIAMQHHMNESKKRRMSKFF